MRRVAVLVVLLAVACSDDGGEDAAATTTTEAPATTTATSTTTVLETTTTTAGPLCLSGDLPEPTGELTSGLELDALPGEDSADALLVDDRWHLRVLLGDGGAIDETLTTGPNDVARVLSAADLDGDGTVELWVQVGTGAAATIIGLYDLDGCDLEPVLLDGLPAEFAIGGTVLQQQGLACGESDLTVLTATSVDGTTYETLDTTYELLAGALVVAGEESSTRTIDDPAMAAYADFAC